jgi:phage terminase large subunit
MQALWHHATLNKQLRRILVGGAAAPGKSYWLRQTLYHFALKVPGCHILLLRRTHKDLDQSHLRFLPHEVSSLGGNWRATDRIAVFSHAGKPDSVIRTGHMESDTDVENYLSAEYDIIAPDELVTFKRDVMLELFTRARTTNPAMTALRGDPANDYDGAFVISASNPGGQNAQWIKDLFIDQEPDKDEFPGYIKEQWAFYPAKLVDNPYVSIQGYTESLSTLRDARKRQLLDGDWTVFEGQFFDNFKTHKHVKDLGRLDTGFKRFLSLDWGLGSPGCVLWWVCLPDGRYHIEQEYKFNGEIGHKVYVKDVAGEIKRRCKALGLQRVPLCWVDPDITLNKGQIGESIAETFQRHGVPTVKSNNDRINGWQRVYEMFRDAPDGTPWLTVDPGCKYLIRTVPLQMQDKNNPEDVNTHGDDHAADALRYGAMSRTMFLPTKPRVENPMWSAAWWRQQGSKVQTNLLGSESR